MCNLVDGIKAGFHEMESACQKGGSKIQEVAKGFWEKHGEKVAVTVAIGGWVLAGTAAIAAVALAIFGFFSLCMANPVAGLITVGVGVTVLAGVLCAPIVYNVMDCFLNKLGWSRS